MDILWLDAIGDEDRARVGGKAAALARLRRAGLPVPDGFVLTARAALDAAGRAALLEAYRRLGGPVAVRSSATAEDLPEASYAGQYASVLDVAGEEALLEAAARCLASAPDAAAYARAMGAAESARMAVLVQRFVEPLAAGVVFTRHPAEATRLLVEAHAGRGDAVVAGAVTPDRYVLDRATGAERDRPEAGCLDASALARIASLAREAEALFGAPQDVEWALGPDGPVLLQSRPITVEPEEGLDPRARRLTRANVGEVLPGPVTPLTWTTVCAFLERGFHAVAKRAGLLPEDLEGSFLVLHRRRLYLNLTLCLEAARRLPGVSLRTAERLLLGQGGAAGEGAGSRLAALPRALDIGRRLLRLAARLPDDVERAALDVRSLPSLRGPCAADAETLARRLRAFEQTGRRVAETHVACSGASGFRLALLEAATAAWLPGDPVDRVNRLLAGQGGVASAAPALALESLAAEARAHAEWRAWLQGEPAALAAAFDRGDGPAGLIERLRGLLAEHGHRAVSEGELSAPSWDDDPTLLFAALRPLLATSRTPGFGQRAQAELRQADEEAVFCRLGPLRGRVFRWLLRSARDWVRQRERTKSLAIGLVEHGRRLALRSGELLRARGTLRQADDVFFLTLPELLEALAGGPVPKGLARRRRRHEREGALPAPRELDLERPHATSDRAEAGLDGTGVSAGTGIGPARVLRPGDPLAIEPGEVLVAPVLDAAYGPLLASAAGAVAEIGGLLSHGSVVARELGVPCVVDVRDATRRIRSGQRLIVDGGAGRVAVAGEDPPALESEAPRTLAPADPADERLHVPDPHPLARESVYFNAFDPRSGIALVASVGLRRGRRGESVAALALPDGRVLFALNLGPPRVEPGGLDVGGIGFGWNPVALRVRGPLADPPGFPPGPLPLLLHPRTAQVELDLRFEPRTPAVDLAQSLPPRERGWLAPLARRHVEQSGRYLGRVSVDGRAWEFDGCGSRDHSWGVRDWEAADHWRLLTVHFGHELALHALSVSCRGRRVEGGFVWREGRAAALARVAFAPERSAGRVRSFEAELQTVEGERLGLAGQVQRTIRVPVQPEWRPWRLLRGRPYRLLLHENYTRYECEGRVGYGMAEVTERPQ